MAKIDGATLLVRNLKRQGVEYMFGVVSFPVQQVTIAAQQEGITYIGMRNEQAASYAAQAAGYLTGRPGACLTVCGRGSFALSGLANAQRNCWPMILIGGAPPTYQNGMGSFQEERQVHIATPLQIRSRYRAAHRIPYYVEQAVRTSIYGRPGAVYLDFSDDMIRAELDEDEVDEMAVIPDPHARAFYQTTLNVQLPPWSPLKNRSQLSVRVWRGHAPRTKCGALSNARSCHFWHRQWAKASSVTTILCP